MASITVLVRPATKTAKGSLRLDRRGNSFINAQDIDTNQYITVYPFEHNNSLFPEALVGKTVVLSGTLHPLGENVKMIAKTVDVVK